MALLLQLPDDPNKGQNRIPSHLELKTLRALHVQNCQLVDHLEGKLNVAKQDHETIQRRYQEKIHELDCIKSELNASYRFIALMEQQRTALEGENKQIKGLIHPIRRCPEDILRSIFEWAVHMPPFGWFYTATIISHVCRTWRAIAIDTSILWRSVEVSMQDSIQVQAHLFEMASERLRSTKPKITLLNIGDPDEEPGIFTDFIVDCELERFSAIDSLNLELMSSRDLPAFSQDDFKYPRPLRKLNISVEDWEGGQVGWNLAWLLRNFTTVVKISLRRCGLLFVQHSGPSTSLRILKLTDMDFSLHRSDIRVFEQLQEITIDNVACEGNPLPGALKLPNLLKIKARGSSCSFLKLITAPNLRTAFISLYEEDDVNFLRRHPSIRHLDIQDCRIPPLNSVYKTIATPLSRLESLTIHSELGSLVDWEALELHAPPFPNLTKLVCALSKGDPVPWAHLERLMQTRCLIETRDHRETMPLEWVVMCGSNATYSDILLGKHTALLEECSISEEVYERSIRLCLKWAMA